jgi:hypothetical protein
VKATILKETKANTGNEEKSGTVQVILSHSEFQQLLYIFNNCQREYKLAIYKGNLYVSLILRR